MDQHPNDVLVKDGWHIVRNEDPIQKVRWYSVYHNHEGMGGMYRTVVNPHLTKSLSAHEEQYEIVPRRSCRYCDEQAPAVVDGFMRMIKWSEEHAD
jgi:hypothetical protein